MKSLLMLAIVSSYPATVHAADAGSPSARLFSLERALIQIQDDWKRGAVTAEQHQASLAGRRADLAIALEKSTPSTANIAVHSRILALLGDRDAAIQDLKWTSPEETALALSIGQTFYEQANYAAALDVAEKILQREPKNDAALFLKHSSTGRVAPNDSARTEVAAQTPPSRTARADVVFSAPSKKQAETEIPFISANESSPPDNNPWPIWPLLPVACLGAGVYAVAKSRRTVESEEGFNANHRPQPGELQRFVTGSILSGLAAIGLYMGGGYVLSVGAPLITRFMTSSGQQVIQIARSEVGAINPGNGKAVNELPKTFARVIPNSPGLLDRIRLLGAKDDPHTFVTAAEDISGLNAQQLHQRLGIARASEYIVIRFPAINKGTATPIRYNNPQFIGRGLTSGKAREFIIQNGPIPSGAQIEVVK